MTEYELSDADLGDLLEASNPVAYIAAHCGPMSSPQERVNAVWKRIGNAMGFNYMTAKPSRYGQQRFIWAEPLATLPNSEKGGA